MQTDVTERIPTPRRQPNLGLVCILLCNLCYLYSLAKMDCGVLV